MRRFFLAIKLFFVFLFTARLPRELAGSVAPALPPPVPEPDRRAEGAVQALAVLQREGRLVDFLLEDIEAYSDAQIGAAVRGIHRGCRKALDEHFPLAPVLAGHEEERVDLGDGTDPACVRVIGATGVAARFGVLRHHGWRVTRVALPHVAGHDAGTIVAPAEVDVGFGENT